MARPHWKEPEETIPSPMTRMTLWLHSEGDAEQIALHNAVIMKQLDDLDVACLLFLKNLAKISIEYYNGKGESEKLRCFTRRNLNNNRVALETLLKDGSCVTNQNRIYHITRQNATGLPPSGNRDMTLSPENFGLQATAEVILAFPLNAEALPITDETQHLFAFLPVRKLNYKFLIHSDFDTDASRQDILVDSPRNQGLLDWVAKAFTRAALQFSEDASKPVLVKP
ncbi:hypothetical protein LEL_09337 [Akanthomyces lecanii RCEF 1005]|uniref:Uncharacterized protein n=1 Tax=Akanthomyces lecanii RCEF 1005 TaxID=1081108 RepID=A0A168BZG8_CORDF|nr:hypothetical protein LEL_09337 [Akanthomyces lecanii RCEF 1005]